MRVRVTRFPRPNVEEAIDVDAGSTAEAVVRRLGLHPEAVLVVRENSSIPLDCELSDGDQIKVIHVVSGG
jgi:sulfur carrier protein ThiS